MAFSGVFLNIVVLLVVLRVKIVDAKEKPLRNNEPIESEPVLPESGQLDQPDEDKHFNAFVSTFLTKRKEQKQIVQYIKDMRNMKKQENFLKVTLTALFKSLKKSRQTLDDNNYQVGDWPEGPTGNSGDTDSSKVLEIRSALSSVLENFALFCDLVLFFPDYVQARMKLKTFSGEKSADPAAETIDTDTPSTIIKWAVMVANIDQFLFSEQDRERTNLALQQLKLIPRADDFVNPNSKEFKVEKLMKDLEKDKTKKVGKTFEKSQAKKNKEKFEQKRKLTKNSRNKNEL